jgi:pentatricopeptide repeat protein
MISIYQRANQLDLADQLYKAMIRKFKVLPARSRVAPKHILDREREKKIERERERQKTQNLIGDRF